jgi:anti-anti-sigma factor
MSLSIETREVGSVVVLDLIGESSIMDGTIVQATVRALTDAGKRRFIFNLAKLQHLDSFGLGQLVATYIGLRRDYDGDLRLACPVPSVKNLLHYTRLDTVLEVFATEDEAVQSLNKFTAST